MSRLYWLLSLLVAGLFAARLVQAQPSPDDHLVPPTTWLTLDDIDLRYRSTVRHLLLPGAATRALMQVVVLPSFAPEYSLTIEHTGSTTYTLTYRLAQRNIWQASGYSIPANVVFVTPQGKAAKPTPRRPATDSVAVVTRQVALPPQLAQALADVLSVALAQTRYPVEELFHIDGTRLLFSLSQPNIGYRSGEAFAPAAAGSHLAALIELAAGLRELASAPDHPEFSQYVLLTDAQQLLIRLAAR